MQTTVVNIYNSSYDIYIGRGSIWGNPFYIGIHGDREEVIDLYRQYILGNLLLLSQIKLLKGKILGCHCKPNNCHGDVLVDLSNGVLKMYKKLIIGIDQSYTRTGISIAVDGRLIKVTSIPFRGLRFKSEKRKHISHILSHILALNVQKATEVMVICERIRTFSTSSQGGSSKENKAFISTNYIKSTGALIGVIVDAAFEYGIEVYSADTRAWKSSVVGSTKAIKGDKKLATVKFVISKGFGGSITSKNKKGKIVYDNDAADSAAMALYGFKKDCKLKLEQ